MRERTIARNNEGIWYEKNGDQEKAISLYEENISEGYPATHSYDRLFILYRKRKQFIDELRVLDIAIEIFSKENEKRFRKAIKAPKNEEYKEILQVGMETCTSVKNNEGWFVFNPYPVIKYVERRVKVLKMIKRQNERSKNI